MIARLVAALLAVSAAARAEDRFGARGQVVPSGTLSFRHTSQNGADTNSLAIAPGVLWFAADSVAVGVSLLYAYTEGIPFAGQTIGIRPGIHSVGFAPVIGVSIPLADKLALFPRFSIRFQWNLPDGGGSSLNLITLRGFAPVVFVPAPHFFLGFGPEFSADVSSSFGKETGFGVASEIGGWF